MEITNYHIVNQSTIKSTCRLPKRSSIHEIIRRIFQKCKIQGFRVNINFTFNNNKNRMNFLNFALLDKSFQNSKFDDPFFLHTGTTYTTLCFFGKNQPFLGEVPPSPPATSVGPPLISCVVPVHGTGHHWLLCATQ
jgi:hypothetical protein